MFAHMGVCLSIFINKFIYLFKSMFFNCIECLSSSSWLCKAKLRAEFGCLLFVAHNLHIYIIMSGATWTAFVIIQQMSIEGLSSWRTTTELNYTRQEVNCKLCSTSIKNRLQTKWHAHSHTIKDFFRAATYRNLFRKHSYNFKIYLMNTVEQRDHLI